MININIGGNNHIDKLYMPDTNIGAIFELLYPFIKSYL